MNTEQQASEMSAARVASYRRGYRARFGVIALVLLGWGAYCLYDGLIAYPAFNDRLERSQEAYETFQQSENGQSWADYSQGKDLRRDPDTFMKQHAKGIISQYIMGGASFTLAFLAGGYFFVVGRWWIKRDADGFHNHRGQFASWASIRDLDKSRWRRKGIADIKYVDEHGSERRLRLDDWKYETEPVAAFVSEIETWLGKDKASTSDASASTSDESASESSSINS